MAGLWSVLRTIYLRYVCVCVCVCVSVCIENHTPQVCVPECVFCMYVHACVYVFLSVRRNAYLCVSVWICLCSVCDVCSLSLTYVCVCLCMCIYILFCIKF